MIWIILYFLANTYLLGMLTVWLAWKEEEASMPFKILTLFSCALVGLPLVVIIGISAILLAAFRVVYKPIERYFQLRFFAMWIFTKKWHNVDENVLYKINWLSKKQPNNIRGKLYRYGVRLVNKKNNYTYHYTKDPE